MTSHYFCGKQLLNALLSFLLNSEGFKRWLLHKNDSLFFLDQAGQREGEEDCLRYSVIVASLYDFLDDTRLSKMHSMSI